MSMKKRKNVAKELYRETLKECQETIKTISKDKRIDVSDYDVEVTDSTCDFGCSDYEGVTCLVNYVENGVIYFADDWGSIIVEYCYNATQLIELIVAMENSLTDNEDNE